MIEIFYDNTQVIEGRRFTLEVQGHSGYSERGKDIVCAAVSSLTIALIKELESLDDKVVIKNLNIKAKDGAVKIECIIPLYHDIREVERIFDTIYQGYKFISEEYQENVRLI